MARVIKSWRERESVCVNADLRSLQTIFCHDDYYDEEDE